MEKRTRWALGPEIQVEKFEFQDDCWVVSASGAGTPVCPGCGNPSNSRHSWHNRQLQDLQAQGVPVALKLRLGRWSNGQAEGQISRLKTLKRAMYGRAGAALLRARMIPVQLIENHTV